MNIGEQIRELRIKKGLTQKQLGELCNMADSAIRRYESGRARPKVTTLLKIVEALDADIFDILDNTDYLPPSNDKKFSFMNEADVENRFLLDGYMDKLNESGQSKAIEQVAMLTKIPEYQKQSEENSNYLLNAAHELTEIKKYTEKEAPDSESDQWSESSSDH